MIINSIIARGGGDIVKIAQYSGTSNNTQQQSFVNMNYHCYYRNSLIIIVPTLNTSTSISNVELLIWFSHNGTSIYGQYAMDVYRSSGTQWWNQIIANTGTSRGTISNTALTIDSDGLLSMSLTSRQVESNGGKIWIIEIPINTSGTQNIIDTTPWGTT